jgi:hypothetical protein
MPTWRCARRRRLQRRVLPSHGAPTRTGPTVQGLQRCRSDGRLVVHCKRALTLYPFQAHCGESGATKG